MTVSNSFRIINCFIFFTVYSKRSGISKNLKSQHFADRSLSRLTSLKNVFLQLKFSKSSQNLIYLKRLKSTKKSCLFQKKNWSTTFLEELSVCFVVYSISNVIVFYLSKFCKICFSLSTRFKQKTKSVVF